MELVAEDDGLTWARRKDQSLFCEIVLGRRQQSQSWAVESHGWEVTNLRDGELLCVMMV